MSTYRPTRVEPACWDWPLPVDTLDVDSRFGRFHAGRCAVCGATAHLVADCTPDTDILRGYICHLCAPYVDRNPDVIFRRYRRTPPALLLEQRVGCIHRPTS